MLKALALSSILASISQISFYPALTLSFLKQGQAHYHQRR
jgi:hypothetical protein